MENKSLIQSYIVTTEDNKGFFVSTIDRDSSAMVYPAPRYAETIVWEWDRNTRETGRLVYMDSDIEGRIDRHMAIVETIYKTKEIPKDAEEDEEDEYSS